MPTYKNRIVRLGISCILAALVALATLVGGVAAYAADPCNSISGGASCDIGLSLIVKSDGLSMSSVSSEVDDNNPITQDHAVKIVPFYIETDVTDASGGTSPGWHLSASSTPLRLRLNSDESSPIDTPIYPMLTALDTTASDAPYSDCLSATCVPDVNSLLFTPDSTNTQSLGPLTLLSTPTKILNTGDLTGIAVTGGQYHLVIQGMFILPIDLYSDHCAIYSSTITLTLSTGD